MIEITIIKKGKGSNVDQEVLEELKEYDGKLTISYGKGDEMPVLDTKAGTLVGGHFKVISLLKAAGIKK